MPPRGRSTSLPEQVLERNYKQEPDECWIKDVPPSLFLPTGSTLVNLAMSDKSDGGWPAGRVCVLTGDPDTGKTTFGMSGLAEACQMEEFDDHDLIYIDREDSIDFNYQRVFGKRFCDRVKVYSSVQDEEFQPPETIQELHYLIMDLFDSNRPFVMMLDSLDFLPSKEELDKSQEERAAWKKGKETTGTMGMTKQKYAKRMFREIMNGLRGSKSILILVRQTIANVGGMGFEPTTAAGGRGVEFANRMEPWLSKLEVDKKKEKIIGRKVRVRIRKNHITGKKRDVTTWIYDGYGIQDVKSNLEFLVKEGSIPKLGAWLQWEGKKYQMNDLIKLFNSKEARQELNSKVEKVWTDIEESLQPEWEPRYL